MEKIPSNGMIGTYGIYGIYKKYEVYMSYKYHLCRSRGDFDKFIASFWKDASSG